VSAVPKIYVDFQNADSAGRVRLNTNGSLRDLEALPNGPADGTVVRLEAEELATGGVLRYSTDEHLWVAELDWSDIEQR
jgi:hypothetical protein